MKLQGCTYQTTVSSVMNGTKSVLFGKAREFIFSISFDVEGFFMESKVLRDAPQENDGCDAVTLVPPGTGSFSVELSSRIKGFLRHGKDVSETKLKDEVGTAQKGGNSSDDKVQGPGRVRE